MGSLKWSLLFVCLCFKGMLHSIRSISSYNNLVQLNSQLFVFLLCYHLFFQAKNFIFCWICVLFSASRLFFSLCVFLIRLCFLSFISLHFPLHFTILQLFKLKPHLGQLTCHPRLKVSLDPVWWFLAHLTIQIEGSRALNSLECGTMWQTTSSITQLSLISQSNIGNGQSCWEMSARRAVPWRLIPFDKLTRGLFISGLKYKAMKSFLTNTTQSPFQWSVSNINNFHHHHQTTIQLMPACPKKSLFNSSVLMRFSF